MGSLTIRKLDDATKTKLRLAAAAKGVSMEEEARTLLASGLGAGTKLPSRISATEILRRARALPKEEPLDPRSMTMTHKELTDAMWGEYEGM